MKSLPSSETDVYEVILLEDLVAAVEKSVDERLWRHVFYTPIEELRAELRKLERNPLRRQEVMDELSRLLDKGTGFYHEMITVLRCEHGIDISTVAVDLLLSDSVNAKGRPGDNQDRPQQKKSRSSGRQQSRSKDEPITPEYSKESLANYIQRCFVYLGDLARYRTNIRLEAQTAQAQGQDQAPVQRHSASNWQASCRFYERAITTFPDSGKPFGQMAILASYANDDLDALYWYNLSLGTRCPSVVVRDNLKVFFSRYQNRFRDLLSAISPGQDNSRDDQDMDTDSDEEDSKPTTQQDQALAKCGLDVLFIKIQMDLFAPHLQSGTFRDAKILNVFCRRISENLALGGFDATVQKMIASMIFTVWDLHSRTSTASFMAESTSKGDAMNLKQAQRTGLIYLLSTSAVLLEHQLSLLKPKPNSSTRKPRLRHSLMYSIEMLIAFWISHWDQVWGMIRLEEKWAGMSRRADLSLKKATVGFFRPFVNLLNTICQDEAPGMRNQDDISQKALYLLQRDRNQYFGLLPFRRFHTQFTVCMDIVENQEETQLNRFLLFASKVVQASEGIRGTVVEMSIEPAVSDDEDGVACFRLMDAEDKFRTPPRALVPLSTLPGTVKLPPASAFPSAPRETGQTLLSEYYRGASTSRNTGRRTDKAAVGRPKPGIPVIPQWTCLLDFSVLVWSLPDIKSLLDNRQCLLIVPLDVIDRLDVAKKGTDKENQKAREAIRFLDERMNRSRGHAEPLLIAQNVRDSLGRWNESIPFLVEEEEEEGKEEDHDSEANVSKEMSKHLDSDGQDVEMTDSQIAVDEQAAGAINQKKEVDGDMTMKESDEVDEIKDDDDDEDEIEVRNAMNVPRVWRPILGACLFLLRKREESLRLKDDRFMLLTEDPDLTYYAGWFEIPASTVHGWKAVVSNA
ncbi:hypothetical protein BGZ82_008051 [Podila clonocystis]|nr:hypothetical protein BGZ82_008051 [Podila clonocystis]